MSTMAVQAQVNEKGGAQALTFLGPNLGCVIQEMRIYLGGVLVEAIPYYNRVEEMLGRFKSHDKRIEDYDCGFGYHSGTRDGSSYVSKPIAADGSKVVVWQPSACGLCAQRNYLPTTFIPGGATVEILLVNTQQEVVDSGGSSSWDLSDVRILCDFLHCDPSFITSLSKHILSGNSLTLSFKTYNTIQYTCASSSMQLVSARAFTRLNQAFLTFDRQGAHTATKKQLNNFYLSANGQNISLRSQVGDVSLPDHEVKTMAQHWFRLLHCIGVKNSPSHSVTIAHDTYRSDAYISGTDFEAVAESHGSGMSTHNAPLVMDIRDLGTDANDLPTLAFLTQYAEALVQISADGVVLAM